MKFKKREAEAKKRICLPLREISPLLMLTMETELNLDSIRQLLSNLAVELRPLDHQVSALPKDNDLEYYFIPAQHMNRFEDYYRPGKPYSNYKMLNYARPAISLSFFSKHKYTIDRDVQLRDAYAYLIEHRDLLYEKTFLQPDNAQLQQELSETDALIRQVRANPDNFTFCFSNYHHYYRYWYCSFRYFEDAEQTKTATENEHMLKHTERKAGKVNERVNVIFVDMDYITRPVSYDNKLVDRDLATYDRRLSHGTIALYVRKI